MDHRGTYSLAVISPVFIVYMLLLLFTGCFPHKQVTYKDYGSCVRLNSDILLGPEICVLKKFQGTSVDNKFYINWIYTSNSNRFMFQLESSLNGKNFKPCFYKRGAASPGEVPLMCCVIDSLSPGNVVFFRIKALPEERNFTNEQKEKYNELYSASTIQIKKNVSSKGYTLYR